MAKRKTTSEYPTYADPPANPPDVSEEAKAAKAAQARMASAQPQVAPAPVEGGPEPTPPTNPYPENPDSEPTPAPELPDGMRVFVAPKYRGGKFLAKAGTVVMVPSPQGPWPKERLGDVWVNFHEHNGVFRTNDPVAIAWCEEHPEVCRDAYDPKTPAWVALTEATIETATQGARLPRNTDIEALLRGEVAGLGGSNLVKQARGE